MIILLPCAAVYIYNSRSIRLQSAFRRLYVFAAFVSILSPFTVTTRFDFALLSASLRFVQP